MAYHNKLGKDGELLAVEYLKENGYTIIHTNWIGNRHEIDIIACNSLYLVFIEVKTRSSELWGKPNDAIGAKKMKRMVSAADYYIQTSDIDLPIRFDVISIILSQSKLVEFEHIEDAFLPSLND